RDSGREISSTSVMSRRAGRGGSPGTSFGLGGIGGSGRLCPPFPPRENGGGGEAAGGGGFPPPSLAPPRRRSFGRAPPPRRLGELCLHVGERNPARLEHDQQVVDEVGGFRDQARAILLDRRQHGLDRLLAELLGAMRHALVEQPARIRGMGARLRALVHALFEIAEGEVRHRFCSALAYHLRPPTQIGALTWRKPSREASSLHIAPRPASMAQCLAPCSISGSILLPPIPISPPCGSDRWRKKPMFGCACARSCSGRFSRRRAGPLRRSTSIRPRAAICGATSSGHARSCSCRSGVPIPSRRTVCLRPAWRWWGSIRYGAKRSAARSFARNSPTDAGSTTP